MTDNKACPCGSTETFAACCQAIITGEKRAETPEALMRSRYTAYTLADVDYIFKTMREAALKDADRAATLEWAESAEWVGLTVLDAPAVSTDDERGVVEFVARFRERGRPLEIHERSVFKKIDGEWYYIDGEQTHNGTVINDNKTGRNEPCPCGSGKKFKKCCAA